MSFFSLLMATVKLEFSTYLCLSRDLFSWWIWLSKVFFSYWISSWFRCLRWAISPSRLLMFSVSLFVSSLRSVILLSYWWRRSSMTVFNFWIWVS